MPCDANGVSLPLEDWTTTGSEFICKTCYGGGDGIFLLTLTWFSKPDNAF